MALQNDNHFGYEIRECGIIANETTSHHRQNNTDVSTIGQSTSFNNEQNLYNIASYIRPWRNKIIKVGLLLGY